MSLGVFLNRSQFLRVGPLFNMGPIFINIVLPGVNK